MKESNCTTEFIKCKLQVKVRNTLKIFMEICTYMCIYVNYAFLYNAEATPY